MVGEIFLHDLLLHSRVVALLGVFVDPGEHPVPAVQRDGSDAVAALDEKRFRLAAREQIAAGVEIGMAEIAQLHFVLREQHARDALALNDVVFPRLETDLVQRGVAESVVAEFEAIVEPHLESLDALVDFARLVELFLVDESDDGNLLVAQRTQQFRGHRRDFGRGQAVRHPRGKIVDRDRNLAVGLWLLRTQAQERYRARQIASKMTSRVS